MLPTKRLKILLVLLFSVILLNFIFIQSKSYSVSFLMKDKKVELKNINESQYFEYMTSLHFYYQDDAIKNTSIKYLNRFGRNYIFIFYVAYFLIACIFIFSIKLKKNEDE